METPCVSDELFRTSSLLWVICMVGSAAIQVQITPAQGEISVGESKFFLCEVVGDAKDIDWFSPSGEKILLSRPNISVSRSDESTSILTIYHANVDNAGIYKCLAKNADKEAQATVQVKIFQKITFQSAPSPQEFNEGDNADIVCDVVSSPPPTIIWKHKGSKLQSAKDGESLRTELLQEKYVIHHSVNPLQLCYSAVLGHSHFECLVKSRHGSVSAETSQSFSHHSPFSLYSSVLKMTSVNYISTVSHPAGQSSQIVSLHFVHQPAIISSAELNSGSLDRNVVVRSHARVSSLTLKNVQFTDAGRYLCTASNSIGEDNQQLFLEVRYSPKIMGLVAAYTWEGNPANISCEVAANPRASVVWFRDGIELPSANSTNIKIFNTPTISLLEITPESQNDFGSYNCTATNVIGSESKEFLLIQAEVPSSPKIEEVQPFSSTAVVEFEEPFSLGGVPILKYRVEWRLPGKEWKSEEYKAKDGEITIVGLKPETTYEVKMSAINGKGEGESSRSSTFKTEPVREPTSPILEVTPVKSSNSAKVKWTKQDDGGSPIKHYLIRYKAKHMSDWKPEMRLPSASDYVMLNGLDWNTDYEILVVAENQRGRSEPSITSFRTASEPTTVPDGGSGLGTGAIVGILIVVFLLLLVAVDVTCFFLNQCGLLMCIAVNVCGKAGPGAKSKDIEEGKAAFSKDESKEPIVEVRTEEENAPNQEGGGPTEPNETTPLTEPDGKAVKSDHAKTEPEVKDATAEVKTVPNEAPQANGSESKA
uniref:Neural cell adhesion molecule 1a n=1 Tax=Xiphophorus couchianus TaxID=32473 RepID=A0A3B5MXW0_9TELE